MNDIEQAICNKEDYKKAHGMIRGMLKHGYLPNAHGEMLEIRPEILGYALRSVIESIEMIDILQFRKDRKAWCGKGYYAERKYQKEWREMKQYIDDSDIPF